MNKLNNQLEIKRITGPLVDENGQAYIKKGYALHIAGKGFLSLTPGEGAYVPCGGRAALQCIIDDGGLLDYSEVTFHKPLELIYPAMIEGMEEGVLKPYSLYTQHKNDPIGTELVHDVAAPGIGRITYVIAHIDKSGVYGVMTENTVRELTIADVI